MKKLDLVEKYNAYVNMKYNSERTIKIYMTRLYKYLDHCTYIGKVSQNMTSTDIMQYLSTLKTSYFNQSLACLKIIYSKGFLNQPRKLHNVKGKKSQRKVWKVLNSEEVELMLRNTDNLKHKCMIACLYLLGARSAELLNIKLTDIDRANMTIHIQGGKGNKDRHISISQNLLHLIEKYYLSCKVKPKTYLFESYEPGKQYSKSSLEKVVKKHEKIIGKKLWPHVLRHSIATKMINDRVNILEISRFLGHNSVKTTEHYYHYLQIKGIIKIGDKLKIA